MYVRERLYPSPFKPGDRFEFSNKHGNVTLEAVTEPQPVSKIRFEDVPEGCVMTWDAAEQIALVTDQVRLSPMFGYPFEGTRAGFIRYDTQSTAGWVRVVSLNYTTKTLACEQIASELDAGRNRIIM